MRNGENSFLIQNRLVPNGGALFLIQNRLVQNRMNPFSIQKRPILLVRWGSIAYAPRVPDGRLYDLYKSTYKAHIFMPLIQNPPNKRFGLSRYWTQKRPMQNRENLFLIRERSMPNGLDLFLNQKRLAPNGGTLFLIQKRPIQNGGNGYGVKTWRLYLYRYPIWCTASSTAD